MVRYLTFGLALAGLMAVAPAQGGEKPAKKKGPKAVVLARNLNNPCGVAVQPGTGHVFVSQKGRVIRVDPTAKGKGRVNLEIKGFPTDVYGKGPKYDISGLGLAFIGDSNLIVGGGGHVDVKEVLYHFTVGDKPLAKEEALKAKDATSKAGPVKPGVEVGKGEGNFYGIAVKGMDVFATANGDDTKGWICKATVKDGKLGKLKPYIATKEKLDVDAPTPATIGPDGSLVVGQLGEITLPKDSLLTKYDPETGELLGSMKTGLFDISGLAYSPKSGKLYAVDFAWMAANEAGLFELVVEGESVTAKKIMSLDKPTALAFDDDGTLYISCIGTAEQFAVPEGKMEPKNPGVLLKVTGL